MRGLGSPSLPSRPRPRDFSSTRCADMKTLITLLCCLTPSIVTAADEHLAAAVAVLSTPTGDQFEPWDDTLVTPLETEANGVAATPDIACVVLMHALSVRSITDPFGMRAHAALHARPACRSTAP